MTQSIRRVRARAEGIVQGVYFRASTKELALELALTGWVQNTRDRAVEFEAQGAPEAVDRLVAWSHDGPLAAVVLSVDVQEIDPIEGEETFEIRYEAR